MDLNDRVAGALLRSARLRAGMTQIEFARSMGITQSTLSAYERGARQPTLPTLLGMLERAGFELRMHLESRDDHDDALAAWERATSDEHRDHLRASGYELVSDR